MLLSGFDYAPALILQTDILLSSLITNENIKELKISSLANSWTKMVRLKCCKSL